MKKLISMIIGLLIVFSFLGVTSVLSDESDECISILLEKDTLKVGDNFFICPTNVTINQDISTGVVELVAVNGNYSLYRAKSSGTIVFEHCDSQMTVRIFPKETPFQAFLSLIGRGKN